MIILYHYIIDISCRSKLAKLNEKITSLELKIEYIEARVSGHVYTCELQSYSLWVTEHERSLKRNTKCSRVLLLLIGYSMTYRVFISQDVDIVTIIIYINFFEALKCASRHRISVFWPDTDTHVVTVQPMQYILFCILWHIIWWFSMHIFYSSRLIKEKHCHRNTNQRWIKSKTSAEYCSNIFVHFGVTM
jgi:hypothetical protein